MKEVDVDVLVVGSGAGGLTSAIAAHEYGGNVLVIEKTDKYGGTSATSGGAIWVPNNHLMAVHGERDTKAAALSYLQSCIGDEVSAKRIETFVEEAPKMLKFLEERSEVKFVATPYADYYPDLDGSKDGYRTLDPLPISAGKLGDIFLKIREPHPQTVFSGFLITVNEGKRLLTRAPGWRWVLARLMISYYLDIPFRLKTKRHRRLASGNALVGRCLLSALNRDIPIWLNAPLKRLMIENGAIRGTYIERDGAEVRINTKRGVVLAAGGFEQNQKMREAYLPNPTSKDWSAAPEQNTGDAHRAALEAGAHLTLMEEAWWGPALRTSDMDRSHVMFAERALPGVYVVNKSGKRFLNEAASYDDVGRKLLQHPEDSWIVFDSAVRAKYPVGPLYPQAVQPDMLWSDAIKRIVKKSDTLEGLAEKMGVDPVALKETANRVSTFAQTGVDEDFGKGGNTYDVYYGDPANKPNPCLGPLKAGPFYAFQIYPGDIGTKGGVDVDENAQALDRDGRPIAGLHAIGNTASSVMGRTYPGAGSTIGPAMTFGYVAAKKLMGENG